MNHLLEMASSSMISNPIPNTDWSRDGKRRRKKKSHLRHHSHPNWKSQTHQQIYSSNLRRALARLNLASEPRRGEAVRDAAGGVLAVTAKGRTRWSRAILTKHKRQRVATRSKKPRVSVYRLKGKGSPVVQRKVRFLGRLIPGCRKEPLPVILEEAIDYIPALEMQVRAMTALFNLLSATSAPPTSFS